MDGQLQLDMHVVRKIMENDLKYMLPRRHPALRNPELNPDRYVQGIVDEYTQKVPAELHEELQKMQQQLNDIDVEMRGVEQQKAQRDAAAAQYAERAQEVKSQLSAMLKRLLDMFPDAQHDMVMESLDDSAYLVRMFDKNLGFMDRMFRGQAKKQEFQKLYDEMVKLREEIDVSGFVDMDSKILQNETRNKIESRRHQGQLEALVSRKNLIISAYQNDVQRYEQIVADMHRKVAEFLDAYENRHELRKLIPATLNMQGLNEPVSFFQTIKGISKVQLEKLLQHVGLKTGYGPDQYIVRETVTNMQEKCLELITPFYSSGNARTDITTLMKYLAEHGVVFEGVIAPATYYQINPQSANPTGKTSEDVVKMIQEKLNGKDVISRETFAMQYTTDENKGKYLFRGQTFITSNPMSSYATPTWRTGRTGIAYATSTPSYAVTYASDIMGGGEVSGKTMKSEGGIIVNGHAVGFVTVFKNSKRNVHVGDYDLERMSTNRDLKKYIVKDFWQTETIVSPYNNPVVERYMVVGDKMVRVDDKDDDWRAIMDSMSPDLQRTHITGVSDEYRTGQQDNHGWQFLDRIRKLQEQVEVDAEHKVKTYDIPVDVLEKMGFIQKSNQFAKGTQKLSQQMTFENSQQNVME